MNTVLPNMAVYSQCETTLNNAYLEGCHRLLLLCHFWEPENLRNVETETQVIQSLGETAVTNTQLLQSAARARHDTSVISTIMAFGNTESCSQ